MKKVIFKEERTINVENLSDRDIIGGEFYHSGVKGLLVKYEEDSYIWASISDNNYTARIKYTSINEAVTNTPFKEIFTFENIDEFKKWFVE